MLENQINNKKKGVFSSNLWLLRAGETPRKIFLKISTFNNDSFMFFAIRMNNLIFRTRLHEKTKFSTFRKPHYWWDCWKLYEILWITSQAWNYVIEYLWRFYFAVDTHTCRHTHRSSCIYTLHSCVKECVRPQQNRRHRYSIAVVSRLRSHCFHFSKWENKKLSVLSCD